MRFAKISKYHCILGVLYYLNIGQASSCGVQMCSLNKYYLLSLLCLDVRLVEGIDIAFECVHAVVYMTPPPLHTHTQPPLLLFAGQDTGPGPGGPG